ncbi:MAG: hypothetical protein K2X87_18930 [Gemmataceae bacterium]|nr:hypothetical protein [Gemmataceae bacterium]
MTVSRASTKFAVPAGCLAAGGWLAFAGQPPKAAPKAAGGRQPDREAVGKALDQFVAAFHKGDAKAVAAHWTAEGEYIGDDGATFRGRPWRRPTPTCSPRGPAAGWR